MGSGGDQVSVLEGRGNCSGCHQAADMSHVSQQVGVELHTQLKHTQTDKLFYSHQIFNFSSVLISLSGHFDT